ncbi:magnesium-protoporphyrin IX monomethyl ester anaerobic oxidative cyclase [Synechocystis sp. B12]|nr:magnesium-protoporphyrin IX monomethyl ester anaerobic oxidative cyclase [Synechocystis sp. B12]
MRILILNPPHPAIGSRIPKEQLPPLGLLSIGGPLLDAGHDVTLLDAEFGPLTDSEIVERVCAHCPQLLLIGHSGSTSAHPIVCRLTLFLRKRLPNLIIVYGGVFPTYHFHDILTKEPQIDFIVRGEGEATVAKLIAALENHNDLNKVDGIAFRRDEQIIETLPAPMIQDLDVYRVGWELVDLKKYSYYGGKQAVVIQFSRGCPHLCNYCGQRGFWARWRHRDPKKIAQEIAWLHRTHGVQLFNLADENPTVNKAIWQDFCEAIIAENISITIIGSTRADDIVRDADILHLYRRAGVERFLLGMENTNEATLKHIRKGSKTSTDREAIRLLRQHNILSLATWVTDFEEVRDRDFIQALKQLLYYDPDQIMSLYVTPHRWTSFYSIASERHVIQLDQTKWDYKHQVLAATHMPPWRIFLWVKLIEILLQTRPKALWRSLFQPNKASRRGMYWFTLMGRRVLVHELINFFFGDRRVKNGSTLQEFWGMPQEHQEIPLSTDSK